MTTIEVQVDDDVKRDAETLFSKLGVTMSGAVDVLFRQAIREQTVSLRGEADSEEVGDDEYFNEYNMAWLNESIAQAKAGQVIVKTLEELEAMANE